MSVCGAEEVKQEMSTYLCKGKITKFVQEYKIKAGHVIVDAALLADTYLAFQSIDQIDRGRYDRKQVFSGWYGKTTTSMRGLSRFGKHSHRNSQYHQQQQGQHFSVGYRDVTKDL
jgi:hypothetical protein